MFIIFDPKTLKDFAARSVREVFVTFVARGCEGTKVEVQEVFDSAGLESEIVGEIQVYFRPEERSKLEGARLTHTGAKWIFTSAKITGRCGCGSSFSFDKKLVDKSKIKALRAALGLVAQPVRSQLELYSKECEKNPL